MKQMFSRWFGVKEGIRDVQLDDFSREKLVLCEAISSKLQELLKCYAEKSKGIPRGTMPIFAYGDVLKFAQISIEETLRMEGPVKGCYLQGFTLSRNYNMVDLPKKERAKRQNYYNQRYKPCFEHLRNNVLPWIAEEDQRDLKEHRIDFPESHENPPYNPMIEITEEKRTYLEEQKQYIHDLAKVYEPLVIRSPSAINSEDLREQGQQLLKHMQFSMLYHVIQKGMPSIDSLGLTVQQRPQP